MKHIFVIHGFASAGVGGKAELVREALGDIVAVHSPTLPTDPIVAIAMLERLIKLAAKEGDTVVVQGTSLGGFYAYYLHLMHGYRAVLINPSLNPGVTLRDKLGTVTNHKTGETFEWTERHLEALHTLNDRIRTAEARDDLDLNDVLVLLGTEDERLDFTGLDERFEAATVRRYPGDHRFNTYARILEASAELRSFLLGEAEWYSFDGPAKITAD